MLSTRFGYGRPAFAAARIALRFCAGLKPFGLPKPFGRSLSQTSFFFSITCRNPCLFSYPFFFTFPASCIAMAIACFNGLPSRRNIDIFLLTAFLDLPLASGTRLTQVCFDLHRDQRRRHPNGWHKANRAGLLYRRASFLLRLRQLAPLFAQARQIAGQPNS